ncbi:LAMI_0H09714g1_1 [Lachancea mirantina]|uniref:LAMI_0H09714g1_1 n=1 Tax=Lachancea mirantina TaxID=1230905 RepID=A0A1G4KGY9_9SACH|nr:LAMI_0H09714g1_1 [Lachancea mirantina]
METDVRYSFLDVLDHLPCDVIRSLWTIQGLELRQDESREFDDQEALKEAQHIEQLIAQHRTQLQARIEDMKAFSAIKARQEARQAAVEVRTKSSKNPKRAAENLVVHEPVATNPLKIKINLRLRRQEESVYCFCRDVSYGPMIACDNDNCPTEWFHYECVGITKPPKGNEKWFCSDKCRKTATRRP